MTPGEICFIDQLNSIDTQNITVRQQLIDAILNLHPRIHHKINDTNLTIQDISKLKMDLDMIRIQINTERQEHEDIIRNMEQENEAMKCLSGNYVINTNIHFFVCFNLALKRLFFQAKVDLHRLITFSKHQEYLMSIIEQCKARYEDDSTSNQAVKDTENELSENVHTQRYVEAALDVHRRDIEQICYELEQIYDGKFDKKYESIREYYILLDDLRFDHTMNNVKHSFINDLYTFTYLRFGNIE
jgi:DNA-binding FadR family transcriptional regulator